MNHSLYSSDRMTHLKIAVVGVVCAFVFLAVGLSARIEQIDLGATSCQGRRSTYCGQSTSSHSLSPSNKHGRLVASALGSCGRCQ